MLLYQDYRVGNDPKTIDPFFQGIYNNRLLRTLQRRFGSFRQHHVDMSVSSTTMLNMLDKMHRKKPRRGEVVMVIPNETGRIWLHTKASYPLGVYRLMTGGLEPGEVPHQALHREVEEETGFKVEIDRCLAVITYTLHDNGNILPFASYLFLTTPASGVPHLTDSSEAITGFQAIPTQILFNVAYRLRRLTGRFADWGIFRAVAHEVAGDCLTQHSSNNV
jgi:8-oxo-dGTP pyrophosphatase MutT (NUDIX family)